MKRILTVFSMLVFLATAASATNYKKVVGGDISMLTKYIEAGCTYYDYDGNLLTGAASVLAYMKSQGLNSMRVRLFVDPTQASTTHQREGVCQDLAYVKQLGKQIKDAGLNFLLDLHYSDTWTDPGQHSTPASWNSTDPTTLGNYLYNYTVDVLTQLKNYGAEPDDIQIGNEVTVGMLWPTGQCYADWTNEYMANFALYLKRGAQACREVCPHARIVIHTELSNSGWGAKTLYTTLANYNVDYDIIGLSYYPYYHGSLDVLEDVLSSLESSQPNKKIQIVETGYYCMWQDESASFDYSSTYPITEAGQKAFTEALINKLNSHTNVNGLYWWWMEGNEKGNNTGTNVTTNWYGASLWNNTTGYPCQALASLKNFITDADNILPDALDIHAYFINQIGWSKVNAYANYWTQAEGETVYSDTWPGTACTTSGTINVGGTTYNTYRFNCPKEVTAIEDIPMNIRFNNDGWQDADQSGEMGFLNGAYYRYYMSGGDYVSECYQLILPDGAGLTDHSTDFWCRKWVQPIHVGYERQFTAAQPSTLCLPFALTAEEVSAAGTVYQLESYDGETLTFAPVTTTVAYTPYFFIPAANGQPFLSLGSKEIDVTTLVDVTGDQAVMKGVMTRQAIASTDDSYVFGYLESTGQFVRVKSANINPFRAYITIPKSAVNVNTLQVVFGQSEGVKAPTVVSTSSDRSYTISGTIATPTTKGIIISNGKKHVVK